MKLLRNISIFFSGFALLGLQTAAHAGNVAGATIVYEPFTASATTAVPTLSEWGLMGLMLLMAVIGYRALKGKLGGKTIASILLSGVLVLSSMFGDKVIGQAYALASAFNLPLGGTLTMNGTDSTIPNTSGVPLKIINVTPNNGYVIKNPETTCIAGTTVLLHAVPNVTCRVLLIPEPT